MEKIKFLSVFLIVLFILIAANIAIIAGSILISIVKMVIIAGIISLIYNFIFRR